jgi:cytochrome c oxidase cbb3-type subunit I/II
VSDQLNVLETAPVATVEHDLIRAHTFAALAGVVISACFGLLVASKFVWPNLASEHAAFTWGRLRYNHTQGIFFGWLGNAFLAFLYYVVPRLTNRPVHGRRLGWFIFLAWNAGVVLPGWVLVSLGRSQSIEWAEFPIVVDFVVLVGLLLAGVQFITPFARMRVSEIYISGWYIIGALVFTPLAYPVGNFVPEMVPGGMGAAFSGLWTHDAVGLFVTPFALSTAYYVIPAVTRRPIYSHFISLIGFWLLLFFYPLNGTHHYLSTPLPMSAQRGAILASLILGVTVVLVVANLFLSFRGRGKRVATDIALRFVWTGVVCYLLVSVQGALQALMPLNHLTHFTDWVVGHSHLAMLGFGSFCAIGGLLHAWEHTPGVRYNPLAARWSYWLLLVGLTIMVLDLTVAGIVQGRAWEDGLPWIKSVQSSRGYWVIRAASGVILLSGFVSLALAFTTGRLHTFEDVETRKIQTLERDFGFPELPVAHVATRRRLGVMFVSVFVAATVCFLASFVALGVLPALEIRRAMRLAPRDMPLPTASELRGRGIYMREGCGYCHTQQVRMLDADIARFGAASASWEQLYDTPHQWGTRRIGPDLAREARLRRNDWHLAHLYDPRLVEPTSIMPRFPWLFDGSRAKPTREALDLVAYLQSLGRPARDGLSPRVTAAMLVSAMPPTCACQAIDSATPVIRVSHEAIDVQSGQRVFAMRCSGCHGLEARGDGPAAATLVPHPANLTVAAFSDERLSSVVWNGVPGTAMPSFRDLPSADLRGVIAFVASRMSRPVRPTGDSVLGAAVYRARCASCHGDEGRGDGPAEMRLPRLPADFTLKQPTVDRGRDVLGRGIPGTGMQAMAQNLTGEQRDAVIAYVQSFFGALQTQGGASD